MHLGYDSSRHIRDDIRVPDAEADLYLLGIGIGGFEQRSVEVDNLLRGATAIYHLTAFQSEIEAVSRGRVENLSSLYFAGENAPDTYNAMTELLISRAKEAQQYGYTCFITYGHPLYLVDTSWAIIEEATGLRVKAIPATSFIDRILCDLNFRFDYGVQIYESNFFLLHKPKIDSSVPLIISQVGEVGSDKIAERGEKMKWLMPLFKEISTLFPGDRQCDLIFSPYRSDMAPDIQSARVDELATLVSSTHTGSTLVVHGA